ncbi:MAG: hypothetical protein HY791_22525 [Deltaproteobacteria bacterium]|nr:hypothetical protein [Deltaproteobacteria bacterium]
MTHEVAARQRSLDRRAAVSEIAATVAHEIKNPLAPIRGYAQLLLKKLDAVDPAERPLFEKALRTIEKEATRVDERLRQLMRGSVRERREDRVDLRALLRQVIDLVDPAGLIELETREGSREGWVVGDEDELRTALVNVLENAIEATTEAGGGRVHVALSCNDMQSIEVVDEGAGIAEPERLFEAFFTTKPHGTGLGLRIARAAIEGAGGSLSLANREDGHSGARVRIELPSAPEVDQRRPAEE